MKKRKNRLSNRIIGYFRRTYMLKLASFIWLIPGIMSYLLLDDLFGFGFYIFLGIPMFLMDWKEEL